MDLDALIFSEHWYIRWIFIVCIVIGLLRLKVFIFKAIGFTFRHCCRCRQNLLKKYHDKQSQRETWALVTGGSDGIGYEFCKKFAK